MSIEIHANRVLGTIHVTQNFLGVFQGDQTNSGPKAPTDLNAALPPSPKELEEAEVKLRKTFVET